MLKKCLRFVLLAALMVPLGARAQCPDGATSCSFTIQCTDDYGDGWNGAYISVYQGDSLLGTTSFTGGEYEEFNFAACEDADSNIYFVWHSGAWDGEASFVILNGDGTTVVSEWGDDLNEGDTIGYMALVCPTCIKPSGVTLDTATTSSLTISWTPGATESAWEIMIGDSLIENVTYSPYTIDELPASTTFYVKVRAVCGYDDTSAWTTPVRMLTSCGAVEALPWHDGFAFDQSGEYPMCWTIVDSLSYIEEDWMTGDLETINYPTITSHYSLGMSLYYYYYSYLDESAVDSGLIASPYFAVEDPTALHVTFDAYCYGMTDGTKIQAGVMTDLADPTTFVPLLNVSGSDVNSQISSFEFYTDTVSSLEGAEGVYIAFRYVANNSYNYAYINNINVLEASGCRPPALNSGEIANVTYESVDLSWGSTEADSYDVVLTHNNTMTHYEALEDSLAITGLDGNTYYSAYVASICDEDTTDYLYIGSFTTPYRCYSITGLDIAALTGNAASFSWSYVADMGIAPAGVVVDLYDMTDDAAVVTGLLVTSNTHTFTGLTTNHEYTATFRTICGEDGADTANMVAMDFMPVNPPCAEQDGSSTNSYVPFYGTYNYAYTQSLYDASLLDGIDTIRAIAYEVVSPSTSLPVRTISIYMGYTDTTSLSTSQYIPVTNLTKVVDSATINVGTAGWSRVSLTTPFAPDNAAASNLVIAVVNHTGSWSSISWGATQMTAGSSVYWYQDGGPVDPAAPSATSSGAIAYVPDVRFYGDCGSVDCVAPSAGIIDVDTASISLSWLPGNDETSWTVQYRVLGDTVWTSLTNISASPYTLAGLTPNTSYQVRVGAECSDEVAFSGILAATTECAPMHAPIAAVFNTIDHPCWSISRTYVNTTLNAINIYGTSDYGVVTPQLADSLNTLQVRINARTYSSSPSSTQSIQVGACNADWSTITWIDTVALTPEFTDYIVLLNTYTGTLDHIVVRHTTSSDIYLHAVSVEPIPDCLPVSDMTIDSVTTASVSVSWTSEADNFTVVYKSVDDSAATWQTTTVTDNNVTIANLAAGTHYTFGVIVNCDNSVSDTTFITTNTDCLPATVPFHVDFTNGLPTCWSTVTTGAIGVSWLQSVANNYGYIYSYASSSAANDWLITAPVAIPTTAAADQVQLVYGAAGENESYYANSNAIMIVLASTTGNAIEDFTDTLLIDTLNTDDLLVYRHIPMDNYAGQNVRFAFRSVSRMYGVVFLDEVSVRSTLVPMYSVYGPVTCFTHDTVVYTAVRQEGDTASMSLNWYSRMAAAGQATIIANSADTLRIVYTAGGIDSLSFIATNSYGADTVIWENFINDCQTISEFPWTEDFETPNAIDCWRQEGNSEWSLGTGDYYASTGAHSGTGNALCTHSSDGNTTKLITPVLNLGGDTSALLTFWHIQRDWAGDQDELNVYYRTSTGSNWVLLANFANEIATWTLDSIVLPNTTSTYQVAFEMVDGYGYGVAIDDVTISGVGGSACEAPVIDSVSATENEIYVSFVGDAAEYEVGYNAGGWEADPEYTIFVEDLNSHLFSGLLSETQYTVGVRAYCGDGSVSAWVTRPVTTAVHLCAVPTDLTATNVTLTSATLGWTNGEEGQTAWQIAISGTSLTDTIDVTTNPYTINNLSYGVTYTFSVRAVCSATNKSEWSAPKTFTTVNCQPVPSVTVSDVTSNSAVISWTAPEGATNFEVEYGPQGFQQGTGTRRDVNGATTYTITGLADNSFFDAYVRTVCGEGVASDWSDAATIHTAEVGIDDVASANVSLYPNPASSTVTLTGIEGMATVTVVDMNGRESGKWTVTDGELTIDVTEMAQGAYFVRIVGEQVNVIRKLIVR